MELTQRPYPLSYGADSEAYPPRQDKATSLYRELLLRQWAPIVVVAGVVMLLLYIFWR